MTKKLICLLLCVGMLVSLAACGGGGDKPADGPAKSESGREPLLVVGTGSEPSNLDVVAETNDDGALIVLGSIYEQLMYADMDNNIKPELAESVEVSDDASQYTYHLRKGVKFHDGQEMVADDVVASMNRWLDKAGTISDMVGGARFEKVDDYTVTIKMPAGTAYLNEMIACYGQHAIITTEECIKEADAADDGMLHTFIGTGPYVWNEWVSASHVSLKAYDGYQPYGTPGDYSGWGGYKTPYYDEVRIAFVGDSNTLSAGIQTGEYMGTGSLEMSYYETYANDPNFRTQLDPTELNGVIFNKKEGWGANEKFRQAVQALVNVDDVMYAFLGNEEYYRLYSSYMFEGTAWYTEAGSEYFNQADKERAKQLFAEAGFTENDTFIILCASDSTNYMTFAQVIKQEFEEIGLNCEILSYEWGTFTQIRNNEPDKYHAFLTAFSPKVLPNLNLFLSATWAGWCEDERIQNDLTAIAQSADFDAAVEMWSDLQEYMYAEYVPIIKLGCSTNLTVWNAKVTGNVYKERTVWVNVHPAE